MALMLEIVKKRLFSLNNVLSEGWSMCRGNDQNTTSLHWVTNNKKGQGAVGPF